MKRTEDVTVSSDLNQTPFMFLAPYCCPSPDLAPRPESCVPERAPALCGECG
jgi:hypothetical protein